MKNGRDESAVEAEIASYLTELSRSFIEPFREGVDQREAQFAHTATALLTDAESKFAVLRQRADDVLDKVRVVRAAAEDEWKGYRDGLREEVSEHVGQVLGEVEKSRETLVKYQEALDRGISSHLPQPVYDLVVSLNERLKQYDEEREADRVTSRRQASRLTRLEVMMTFLLGMLAAALTIVLTA